MYGRQRDQRRRASRSGHSRPIGRRSPGRLLGGLVALTLLALFAAGGMAPAAAQPGDTIVLAWNNLGMHCMNQWFNTIAVLPPYNTLLAQVIRRGDALTLPEILTSGLTLEYSIPGNTYSVGKTDFWNYDVQLFGVDLPPNVGLTGKGMTGVLDPVGTHFIAEGIPITPFTDATPTIADPYQQALIIVRDGGGQEIARSAPVIPTAVEMNCISSGCHSSETQILNMHSDEGGFNPNNTPILCAECHASPALGTPGIPQAGYFSRAMHDKHSFIDQQIPGINGCYKCHPGPQTQCLRGTMNNDYGMVCQDCHGSMAHVASTIEQGRVPWLQEPSCRSCHTATYGEPQGQLFQSSQGHGGVYCSGCHGSPHAIFPSREARDNANNIALQGHAGILRECSVCHGTTPQGHGPHGYVPADVVEAEVLDAPRALAVQPYVADRACTIEFAASSAGDGRLLVFDSSGRTVKLLQPQPSGDGRMVARWDTDGRGGEPVPAGVYFVRWDAGAQSAAAKVVVAR
jgi:hypothetical protein